MEMYLEFLRPSLDRPIGMPTPSRRNVTLEHGEEKGVKITRNLEEKHASCPTYTPPTKNGHVSARPASVVTYSPNAIFCHADGSLTNAAEPAVEPAVR